MRIRKIDSGFMIDPETDGEETALQEQSGKRVVLVPDGIYETNSRRVLPKTSSDPITSQHSA